MSSLLTNFNICYILAVASLNFQTMQKTGYIKLHRKIIDSDLFANRPHVWLHIWIYILCETIHTKRGTVRGYAMGEGHFMYKKIVQK